jgi:ubiquinone/menaquinone biosynthesis C-methylase UbiE
MSVNRRQTRLRRFWDRHAPDYDRRMGIAERRYFRDTRAWLAGQAAGDTLEVALGTGLNLPHYPPGVRLTGVEWSPAMLDVARRRAADLGLDADLRLGDAQSLDLPDGAFDTVLCSFALCAIPDARAAFAEMDRVLRPGGLLLLADHVSSSVPPVLALQFLADAF